MAFEEKYMLQKATESAAAFFERFAQESVGWSVRFLIQTRKQGKKRWWARLTRMTGIQQTKQIAQTPPESKASFLRRFANESVDWEVVSMTQNENGLWVAAFSRLIDPADIPLPVATDEELRAGINSGERSMLEIFIAQPPAPAAEIEADPE